MRGARRAAASRWSRGTTAIVGGAAERELGDAIAREAMQPINERYYRDLGADLSAWDVIYDLDPRPGKAPLAYTDYVRRGRSHDGKWRPTITRVSGNYARGGLGLINELVHENGHVVHMMALQTRPAFMDLGDAAVLRGVRRRAVVEHVRARLAAEISRPQLG